MKLKVHTLLSLFVISVCLIGCAILISYTINPTDLRNTLFTLNNAQTSYLILLVICLIILFDIIESLIFEVKIKTILIYGYHINNALNNLLKFFYWFITIILLIFGLLIPLLDLIGSFHPTIINFPELVPKISLLILTTNYISNLFERSQKQIGIINRILHNIGNITFLNREEDHIFMSNSLYEIPFGSEILVTHFEEPLAPLTNDGYYYEKDFMQQWYSTIKDKKLKVKQIILINSKQDIIDFEKRLTIVKDITNYSLGYIVAPPLSIFVDFIVFPNDVLIGLSDDLSMRNMNVFGLVIKNGPGVTKFKNIFNMDFHGKIYP